MHMIRCGMIGGLAVLLAVAVLEALAAPARPEAAPGADVGNQVWDVLAEARRITQESV